MPSIHALVPEVGRADSDGLRSHDAEALADCVLDRAEPSWRRLACAEALHGRVPQTHLEALLACVRDPHDAHEVRVQLLDLLSDREELLPWLRHEDRQGERGYRIEHAVLRTRTRLGDLTALAAVADLAFRPGWRDRMAGGECLESLVDRHGSAAVAAALDGLDEADPAVRALRIRLRDRNGEDITDSLTDPDPEVAYVTQDLITDTDRLRAYLAEAPTVDAALWAAYALYRLTEDPAPTRAVYEALGRPRVEVEGLDEDVRRAIVHEYVPYCENGTDPRWRLEAICTDPPARPDQEDQLRRATAALTAAGLAPKPPVHCGEAHQQGDGTYHVIEYGAGKELSISTLGPWAGDFEGDADARAALESAGFHWMDATTGATRVSGLHVYYFGSRQPMDVHTLLYYWQD
ncbi:hypothetical protein EF903_17030 [Streptomyces sp. WAC05292]|uniref:hypothetical protein n=1 Tax=Streptomyces sp. WAC05292 TaxID=2487418 RepID=UPI000F748D59|nr:hypothetical protein [Streptomyces sp. WAC05292]RSS87674.1 hypothetical protein EF903_17030 [Streptomyces sp. WAC05292]